MSTDTSQRRRARALCGSVAQPDGQLTSDQRERLLRAYGARPLSDVRIEDLPPGRWLVDHPEDYPDLPTLAPEDDF